MVPGLTLEVSEDDDTMDALVVIMLTVGVVIGLTVWACADAIGRGISLWRWRHAYGRQRLRGDVSRMARGRRAA
jgi:hypothetical protein